MSTTDSDPIATYSEETPRAIQVPYEVARSTGYVLGATERREADAQDDLLTDYRLDRISQQRDHVGRVTYEPGANSEADKAAAFVELLAAGLAAGVKDAGDIGAAEVVEPAPE